MGNNRWHSAIRMDFEEKNPETHKAIKTAIKIANPEKYPLSVLDQGIYSFGKEDD